MLLYIQSYDENTDICYSKHAFFLCLNLFLVLNQEAIVMQCSLLHLVLSYSFIVTKKLVIFLHLLLPMSQRIFSFGLDLVKSDMMNITATIECLFQTYITK